MITEKQHYIYNPPQEPLRILYIDRDILITCKPSGLLTVPGKQSSDSLTMRLREKLRLECSPVHRLDTSTSGIILFSLNSRSSAILSEQFRLRIPNKRYIAHCEGIIEKDYGALAYPMSRDWSMAALTSAPVHKVDFAEGKKSLTWFKVVSRNYADNTTTVLLEPHTGRTHQLRVHLNYFGHPICDDLIYGSSCSLNRGDSLERRLQLHSCYLDFYHPVSRKFMRVISPADFDRDIDYLGLLPRSLHFPERRHKAD